MKIYQELYGFYFLFILLVIILAGLATVLFLHKSRKGKTEHQQDEFSKNFIQADDDISSIIKKEEKFSDNNLPVDDLIGKPATSNVVFKTIEADDILQENEPVVSIYKHARPQEEQEMPSEPTNNRIVVETDKKPEFTNEIVTQESVVDSVMTNPAVEAEKEKGSSFEREQPDIIEIKPVVIKENPGNLKQKEFQERYQIIKEKLVDEDKYAMAYKELTNRVNSIKKELLLFRQVINSESNSKVINQVAKIINKSLSEMEKDIKEVPVLVELSQKIIPRMITGKLNEYEKLKRDGAKVEKGLLMDLRGMTAELVEILSRIKKVELEGLLENLMAMARKLDKISIKENIR